MELFLFLAQLARPSKGDAMLGSGLQRAENSVLTDSSRMQRHLQNQEVCQLLPWIAHMLREG